MARASPARCARCPRSSRRPDPPGCYEFVILFTGLLERSYLSEVDAYDGDPIAYIGERVGGDRTMVQTGVTSPPHT